MAYLLQQTDEYIESLISMVKEHKEEVMKKKKRRKSSRKTDVRGGKREGEGAKGGWGEGRRRGEKGEGYCYFTITQLFCFQCYTLPFMACTMHSITLYYYCYV